jgi:hypothetical protein
MTGTLAGNWDVHLEVFRTHAHQLLVWAYQDVRHKLSPDSDEPTKTGWLAEAMKRRLDLPETPSEYDHYWPGDQVPISPDGQEGNERLRLDFSVVKNGIKPRLCYLFEAKRLRTSAYPIGKYVGDEGMKDFVDGRYGRECPEAAMVGLFENKDVDYWHSELKRVCEEDLKKSTPTLRQTGNFSLVEIHDELAGELESHHEREASLGRLRLLHIFLDCRAV